MNENEASDNPHVIPGVVHHFCGSVKQMHEDVAAEIDNSADDQAEKKVEADADGVNLADFILLPGAEILRDNHSACTGNDREGKCEKAENLISVSDGSHSGLIVTAQHQRVSVA